MIRSVDTHLNAALKTTYPIYVVIASDPQHDPSRNDAAYTAEDKALIRSWAPTTKVTFIPITLYSGDALPPNTTQSQIGRWILGKDGAVAGRTLGYRAMCRLWSGRLQRMSFLDNYKFYMRLDDDSLFTSPLREDPFKTLESKRLDYAFVRRSPDIFGAQALKAVTLNHGKWSGNTNSPYTNFHIANVSLFRTPQFKSFANDLDKNKIFMKFRVGDALLHSAMLEMFVQSRFIQLTKLPYAHNSNDLGAGYPPKEWDGSCPTRAKTLSSMSTVLLSVVLDAGPQYGKEKTSVFSNVSTTSKRQFCDRVGCTYLESRTTSDRSRSALWQKIAFINQLLQNKSIDQIVWMDADVVVSSIANYLPAQSADLMVTADFGLSTNLRDTLNIHALGIAKINTGVMFIKNTAWSRQFFQAVWNDDDSGTGINDQNSVNKLMRMLPQVEAQRHVSVVSRVKWNAFPRPEGIPNVCGVPAATWRGDATAESFFVHFAGVFGGMCMDGRMNQIVSSKRHNQAQKLTHVCLRNVTVPFELHDIVYDKIPFQMVLYKATSTQHDLVSEYIQKHGVWDQKHTHMLMDKMQKLSKSTFLDVGANIGWFTLVAAMKGHSVIAVEPFAENLSLLKASLCMNNVHHKVTIYPYGLHKDVMSCDLYQKASHNKGDTHTVCHAADAQMLGVDYAKLGTMHTQRLDTLLSHQPLTKSVVVKIDTEGSEYNAFLGGQRFFTGEHAPTMILSEYRPQLLNGFQSGDALRYIALVQKWGYQVKTDTGAAFIPGFNGDLVFRKN